MAKAFLGFLLANLLVVLLLLLGQSVSASSGPTGTARVSCDTRPTGYGLVVEVSCPER